MVQLKGKNEIDDANEKSNFNSSMVQLKVALVSSDLDMPY